MLRNKTVLACVVCLLAAGLTSQTLSQAGGGSGAGAGFRRLPAGPAVPGGLPKPPKREVTDESREASRRGAVGATDEQWTVIKPKLEEFRQLRRIACIGIMITGGSSMSGGGGSQSGSKSTPVRPRGGGGGGGTGSIGQKGTRPTSQTKPEQDSWMTWRWYKSWGSKPAQGQDEKLCEGLFNLLKDKNAKSEELEQKMDELRKAREHAAQGLDEARKELRELLTLDQEARLVALGWLD